MQKVKHLTKETIRYKYECELEAMKHQIKMIENGYVKKEQTEEEKKSLIFEYEKIEEEKLEDCAHDWNYKQDGFRRMCKNCGLHQYVSYSGNTYNQWVNEVNS